MAFNFYTQFPADGNWNTLNTPGGTTHPLYQFYFAVMNNGLFDTEQNNGQWGYMIAENITVEEVLAINDPDNVGVTVAFSTTPPSSNTPVPFNMRTINITTGETFNDNSHPTVQWQWNGFVFNLYCNYSPPE